MAEQDCPIHLPDAQLASLGLTTQEVDQYPQLRAYSDVLLYAVADAGRKNLVGLDGTNLQLSTVINSAGGAGLVFGQVCLFLVKNRIKPMASDLHMLEGGVRETVRRLGDGNMHAVNRRQKLMEEGVLKRAGDDIVPEAVRAQWV